MEASTTISTSTAAAYMEATGVMYTMMEAYGNIASSPHFMGDIYAISATEASVEASTL